ncbi:MAG: hypothetical protein AAF907_01470, partial [Planctomycetota bacterium]
MSLEAHAVAASARTRHAEDGDSPTLSLRLAAVAGALTCSAVVTLVSSNGRTSPWLVAGEIVAVTLIVGTAACLSPRFVRTSRLLPAWLIGFVTVSLAIEPILRAFGGGRAVEILLLDGFRVSALTCAACGHVAGPNKLSRLLALFTTLFAVGLPLGAGASQWAVRGAVLLFAASAAWGAASAYWGDLRGRVTVAGPSRGRWAANGLVGGLVLATLAVGGGGVVAGRAGLFPTSGGWGSDATDPGARDGVGNGEDLVVGSEDIRSFVPIDDAPFLEDDRPSLFDAYDETYEAPFKPGKNERAQSLTPEQVAERRRRNMTTAGRPSGGGLSTRRKPSPSAGRTPREKPSPALLFVAGRTPVHLRLQTYAEFDGERWLPEEAEGRPLVSWNQQGGMWVGREVSLAWSELFRGTEKHALKVVNLTGPELPCPPNTIGVHIKDVIRADLFGSAGPDTVKLNRTSVPPLTVVHSASRRLDPASFDDPLLFHTLPPGSQGVPDDLLGPLTTTAA